MLSIESTGIDGTEFDTPESDSFAANCDTSFSEQILDISMPEVESEVEPDRIRNDVRWESVAFICIHPLILPISVSLLGSTCPGAQRASLADSTFSIPIFLSVKL